MKQLHLAIPVMPVRGMEAACTWCAESFEFHVVYRHKSVGAEEFTNYAILDRDGVQVHLILDEPPPFANTWTIAGSGYLYLQVQDVISLYSAVQALAIPLTQNLAKSSWGAKGFELRDPAGNLGRIEQTR